MYKATPTWSWRSLTTSCHGSLYSSRIRPPSRYLEQFRVKVAEPQGRNAGGFRSNDKSDAEIILREGDQQAGELSDYLDKLHFA